MTELSKRDSAVFTVDGLEPRMALLREFVLPKLVAAGKVLAPRLSGLVGHELFPHVTRHENPTTPPIESGVAFSRDPTEPRKHVQLALTISAQSLHVRVCLADEAEAARLRAAERLREKAKELAKRYSRDAWLRTFRAWDHGELPALVNPKARFFEEEAKRMSQKSGLLDLGYGFPIGDGAPEDDELVACFEKLVPIYQLAID
jgi:uncharacterized protein YktB (UPF0637 family)